MGTTYLYQDSNVAEKMCLLSGAHAIFKADMLHNYTLVFEICMYMGLQFLSIVDAAMVTRRPVHDDNQWRLHVIKGRIARSIKAGCHTLSKAFHILSLWWSSPKEWSAEEY